MSNTQHNPEIQLELPGMKTGFYIYMNKYSINFPDINDQQDQSKERISHDLVETQLSLAI